MRERRRAERLVNAYADLILRVAYTDLGCCGCCVTKSPLRARSTSGPGWFT